jgi:hypothetical protein
VAEIWIMGIYGSIKMVYCCFYMGLIFKTQSVCAYRLAT